MYALYELGRFDKLTIKDAIREKLKTQVDYENNGMLSRLQCSMEAVKILAEAGITIDRSMVYQNNIPLYEIKRRYAERRTRGCYRQLQPLLLDVGGEQT
jgi:hypothetical protein